MMTAKELKLQRAILGMTQTQFAEALDMTGKTISRYETEDLPIPKTVELAVWALVRQQEEKEKENS